MSDIQSSLLSEMPGVPKAGVNDLPLPDPFPEYLICPFCGEPEVEVWCYQEGVKCHNCGGWLEHRRAECFGLPGCRGLE